MGISKKLNGQTFSVPTLFAVDTLVSRSQRRAKDKAKTTPATYGLGLESVLAFFDPVMRSWKMYAATCPLAELPSLEKLPNSGIARNGVLYRRPPWEPLTAETELLSWPTPRANSAMAAQITPATSWDPKRFPNLETVIGRRSWPTPRSSSAMGETINSIKERLENGKQYKTRLEEAIALDTTETIGGKMNPEWVEWLMGFPPSWTDLNV